MVLLEFIELIAVIAGGAYGVLIARQKRMDFVGVFSVACCAAFGGGTLRDLFLDRQPLFWIENGHYPVIVFVMAAVSWMLKRVKRSTIEKFLYLPDALGLGLFSVTGTGYAMESGTGLFVAALLGVVTGAFGGVISDVICNEVPSLFRAAPLYATCSFVGCWAFLGLDWAGASEAVVLGVSIAVIVLFRLAALRWNLRLPEADTGEDG
ncbi:MAG: putative membrane protein YeiH [Rhodothermales bacterium]|jgi:uncharacterized membrane protein YeiH